MKRIFLLTILALFLAACGGEGTSSEWRTITSEEVGISLHEDIETVEKKQEPDVGMNARRRSSFFGFRDAVHLVRNF